MRRININAKKIDRNGSMRLIKFANIDKAKI